MAGLRPIEMERFYRKLGERGLTVNDIAAAVGRSRPTVTRVLNGSRRRGPIWKKVERILLPSEIALLDVALCSPWNNRRLAKRPVWTPEKAATLAPAEPEFSHYAGLKTREAAERHAKRTAKRFGLPALRFEML